MSFRIEKQVVVQRGSLAKGTNPTFKYEPHPGYPEAYPTRIAAVRALMTDWDPDLKNTPDAHIERHYQALKRNLGYYRVARLIRPTVQA